MPIPLPPLSWRGIEVPWTARRYGFTHQQALHKLLFRSIPEIERLGTDNPRWSFTIPLEEGIQIGRWANSNLFTITLPRFITACFDKSPGELIDPVLGEPVQAVTVSYSDEMGASRTGATVQVEWMQFPGEEAIDLFAQKLATVGLVATATEGLELQLGELDLPDAPQTGELLGFLQLAQNAADQGELAAGQFTAQVSNYVGTIEQLTATAEKASDPLAWQLIPTLNQLNSQGRNIIASANGARQNLVPFRVPQDTTLGTLAVTLDTRRDVLLQLNPALSAGPVVPAGTEILKPDQ